MNEDYDYDDDEHDYDDAQNKYKHYFKFDPNAWDAWGKMLYDALNDVIEGSPNVWYVNLSKNSFPVNSYISSTGKNNTFQYLGVNYQGSPIWKKKYFANNDLQIKYINHLKEHAVNFILQPHYYKGLFDIMN
jgi:hypothetical protein